MNNTIIRSDASDHEIEMFRGAPAKITKHISHDGKQSALLHVGDHQHKFGHASRVSKALAENTPEQLTGRFSGGHYMFVDGELVSWRDASYNGFIHTDEAVRNLAEHVGISNAVDLGRHRQMVVLDRARRGGGDAASTMLMSYRSSEEFDIPEYKEGGNFTTRVGFSWDPFVHFVTGTFDIVRMICSNGAMGISNLVNTRVPIVNLWEQHMDIATAQLQNAVTNRVKDDMVRIGATRASLDMCRRLCEHIEGRLKATAADENAGALHRLMTMHDAINPERHLSDVYQPLAFTDSALGANLPSHLTGLDLYNAATELATHFPGSSESSAYALQRMSNSLLFDRQTDARLSTLTTNATISLADFSDPEKAFFS